MGGLVLGILAWQEGGESVGRAAGRGAGGDGRAGPLAAAPQARGQARPARPAPVRVQAVQLRDLPGDPPAHRPGRDADRAADLPPDGARLQRDGGGPVARAAVADDVRRRAGRRADGPGNGGRAVLIRAGFALLLVAVAAADPDRPARGQRLVPRRSARARRVRGSACWSPSSTTTRWRRSRRSGSARPPASTRRPGPSASPSGWRSPARSCWPRSRSRSPTSRSRATCSPRPSSSASPTSLEDDAQVMSNAQLEELLADQPEDVREEIVSDQRRRAAARAPGRAARSAARGADRPPRGLPNDAPARSRALRGGAPGMTEPGRREEERRPRPPTSCSARRWRRSARGLPGGARHWQRPPVRSPWDVWLPSCLVSVMALCRARHRLRLCGHRPARGRRAPSAQPRACADRGTNAPLSFWLVALFTAGGVLLALTTIVLVIAQT